MKQSKTVDATQTDNGNAYQLYTGQTNPAYFGLPTFTFQGGFSFQLGLGWPKTVGPDGVYQITDTVSLLRGKHALKFGGEILVNQSTNNVTANTKGPVRFPNLQSFFSGNMNRALIAAGDFLRHLQNEGYALFVQDDWRLAPKLTVNLGVRYELNTVVKESNNLIGNFDPSVGLVQAGKQVGSVFNGDHNNFAPRAGLAWDMAGNGKTVIRAGGGIYYEQGSFDAIMALGNPMTQRTSHGVSFVLGYTYAHALAMSSDNWTFRNPINAQNARDLYGSSEFDVRHRFTYSLTYAIPGLKAPGQILQGWSLNSIVSMQSGLPWGVNDTTTDFSGTGEVNAQNSDGERWNFFGSPADFKTSKALFNTNGGNGGIPYFPGTSNADCLAKATATGPLAVASLTNLGCYASGSSVLVPPAYGSYGTLGRNVFRSLPYYDWDMSVTKVWRFRERLTAQFRAEFFNILNHPNISNPFGGPGGDNSFTDPSATAGASFGFRPETPDVTSSNPVLGSGGPRAIQLGLKMIF